MKKAIFFLLLSSQLLFSSLFAQTNYAISMNGTSNSFANLGTINPTGNFSTGITIECWVKWGAFNNWSRLLDIGNGTANDNILFANQGTTNSLRIEVYRGGSLQGLSGPANLVTGRWYHVAVTITAGSIATLYVDGASVASGSVWLPNNIDRTSCFIGKSNWAADGYLNAEIDEMRIWSIARTQQELKSSMFKAVSASATGLVAYYKANENGGSTLVNSKSGAGAGNGTTDVGLTWAASPIQHTTNALHFDGTNDVAVIPHVVSSDFTIEYWMRTSTTGSGNASSQWYSGSGIVDAEVGGVGNDWGTSLTGQYLAFGIGNPDVTIRSTSIVNTGNWVHVAATWQQSTGVMRLFINGVEEASATGSTNLRTSPPRITLGQIQTNIQPYAGAIDELRIWNVVRTPAQIMANKDIELDPAAGGTANMLAYYTFDQNIATGVNTGVVTVIDQKNTNNATLSNFALTGATSNFISQQNTFAALSVEWLAFTATKLSNAVQLVWKTASEQNSSSFTVQRSVDAVNWKSLSQIPAAGNSNSIKQYAFTDASPVIGRNYYRLKQTDIDGKVYYSEIRNVRFGNTTSSFVLMGNPVVNDVLKIQLNEHTNLQAALYGANGELLLSIDLKPGINSINVGNLLPGVYWLRTAAESKKVVVQ